MRIAALVGSGRGAARSVVRQTRRTTTFTIPDQTSNTPQTNATGPRPATALPSTRTAPHPTMQNVMIQSPFTRHTFSLSILAIYVLIDRNVARAAAAISNPPHAPELARLGRFVPR